MVSDKIISPNQEDLAIVIPAYKKQFFHDTLRSLEAQKNKNFKIYVGDDCSPDNLKQICDQFSHTLDITYTRFKENFGSKSLITHWNRCVELSHEPWICLFCDDDIMEPGCVESFFSALKTTNADYSLYRFNTITIDDTGRIIHSNPPHPQIESGIQFAYARLCLTRKSFVSEYIFSRKSFQREGGFVEFPAAWGSDDASWIAFAGDKDIFTISDAKIHWRYSGSNISSQVSQYQGQKIDATFQFIDWLNQKFTGVETDKSGIDLNTLNQSSKKWFYQAMNIYSPLGFSNIINILSRYKKKPWHSGLFRLFFVMILIEMKYYIKLIPGIPEENIEKIFHRLIGIN